MAAEYKMKTAFENLTQLPIFLKIIFTAGRRKLIDICKIVVYYVYIQKTTNEKHRQFHSVFNGSCR